MSIERQAEREEDAAQRQFDRGDISRQELNEILRDIDRDARDAYREERARAHEELDDRMGWGYR